MREKGTHTYDIALMYHRCPKCGNIIESRDHFRYRFGKYYKDVECDRCHHLFSLEKQVKPSFAPLFD